MPAALPIQSTPVESDSRQFKSADGKPARAVKARHWPFESSFRPFGVANHIVPSGLSAIEVTALDERPFAVVYVVKRPSLNSLNPSLRVPAHTVPSRL